MPNREVVIVNKLGLHARAASKLVTEAGCFQAEIRISKDGREVSGKSIMGVMMLAAARGSRIRIAAEGRDARQALDKLEELVRNRFGEEE